MSHHAGTRVPSVGLRTSKTSVRDDEVVVYAVAGLPSGTTTPAGGPVVSTQRVLVLQEDAPDAGSMMYVSVDGGTTFSRVATLTAPSRVGLSWVAGARGKPGLNADILNATEATRMVTDPDFEILGTNASSDDVTFNAEGGITFTTDGADGDEVILLPHLDANQSAWTQWTWGTDKSLVWECRIETGAAITNSIIWAGLKLTNTEVTATDDDQAMFRYENGVNDGEWQAVTSVGGTDDAHDTGVVVAVDTTVRLKIVISSARVPTYYIDDVLVETGSAMTDTTDLIPYIGIAADGAAEAKTLTVFGQSLSRTAG